MLRANYARNKRLLNRRKQILRSVISDGPNDKADEGHDKGHDKGAAKQTSRAITRRNDNKRPGGRLLFIGESYCSDGVDQSTQRFLSTTNPVSVLIT